MSTMNLKQRKNSNISLSLVWSDGDSLIAGAASQITCANSVVPHCKPPDISCSNKMAAKAPANTSNGSNSSDLQICDLSLDENASLPYPDDSPLATEWDYSSSSGSSDTPSAGTLDGEHDIAKPHSQTTMPYPPINSDLPPQAPYQKSPNQNNTKDTPIQSSNNLAPKLTSAQPLPPLYLSKITTPYLKTKTQQIFAPFSPPKATTKQKQQQNPAPKSLPKATQKKKRLGTLPTSIANDATSTNHSTLKPKIVTPMQQYNNKRTTYSLSDKSIKNLAHRNMKPLVRLYNFTKTKKKATTSAAINRPNPNEPMDTDPCPTDFTNPGGTPATQSKSSNAIDTEPPKSQPTQSLTCPQNGYLTLHDSSTQNPKVPHIFLSKITEIKPLLDLIKNSPGIGKFSTRTSNNGEIKIQSCNISTYNAIRTVLNNNLIDNYTHQTRNERGYRIIIRHLHHSTPQDWISEQLQKLGYVTRYINVIKHRRTGKPANLFEIELAPRLDRVYDNILTLTKLGHQEIAVEKQRRRFEPVQCHRCQAFGHTRNYCHRPFTCLKCAGPHATETCTITRNLEPKCANCGASHVANYKGCRAYKNARSKLIPGRERDLHFGQHTANKSTTWDQLFLRLNALKSQTRNNTLANNSITHQTNKDQTQPKHQLPHPPNQTHFNNQLSRPIWHYLRHTKSSNLTYSQVVQNKATFGSAYKPLINQMQLPKTQQRPSQQQGPTHAATTTPRYLEENHPTSLKSKTSSKMQIEPEENLQGEHGEQQQSHTECRLTRILEKNLQTTLEMSIKIYNLLNILYSLLYPSLQQEKRQLMLNTRIRENTINSKTVPNTPSTINLITNGSTVNNNNFNTANDLTHG